ncbi:MAG: cupin domain-containing protein [Desulfatitalea sp.]|nr:cupin domain-containing protein [Desulfatitalea sp.]NNJ99286.1 cupin domain-containing protein [Desulfatitalea sp.]
MIVADEHALTAKIIDHPEAKDAAMKVLVGAEQGWQDYVMRVIELDPGGHSPAHVHPWPHINYMLEGQGTLLLGEASHAVQAGAYAFVPSGTFHQFKNTGEGKFRFICIVPKAGHK